MRHLCSQSWPWNQWSGPYGSVQRRLRSRGYPSTCPFPQTDQRNRYIVISVEYFTKWLEAYAVSNQESSTVAETLVTNFGCRFGVPREVRSDQGYNFDPSLTQEVLQHLAVSKTGTTPLHPQSGSIMERCIKTAEEHLRKVTASYQKDWDARLPLFLLAYRAYIHDTSVRERTPPAQQPAIWGSPRQVATHHEPCCGSRESFTRYLQSRSPTSEAGQ